MKRGYNIKRKTSSTPTTAVRFNRLSSSELKTLIHSYQQGDPLSAELLCQNFAPLVKRLAHRQYVYNSYGEDAENMLWLWLLEFFTTYEGDNFRMLPGLARRHLICKLMRTAEQNSRRWKTEQTTDLSDTSQMDMVEENDLLQQTMLNLALKQELDYLPKKQYHIIRRFYMEQEPQKEIACSMHCTPRAVRLQQKAALKSIRKNLIRS